MPLLTCHILTDFFICLIACLYARNIATQAFLSLWNLIFAFTFAFTDLLSNLCLLCCCNEKHKAKEHMRCIAYILSLIGLYLLPYRKDPTTFTNIL